MRRCAWQGRTGCTSSTRSRAPSRSARCWVACCRPTSRQHKTWPEACWANLRLGLALSEDEIEYLARATASSAAPDRCRADDVRAGQLRALPAQDLQRQLDASTARRSRCRCSAMIKHTHRSTPRTRCRPTATMRRWWKGIRPRFFARSGHAVYRARSCAADRLRDQGRNPQPPDRDRAVSRRQPPVRAARSATKGATGRGGKPKAGLTGFSVSHLRIPTLPQPWEAARALNPRMASPLRDHARRAARRRRVQQRVRPPQPGGYFRSFEHCAKRDTLARAYDKPIMLAGGLGNIDAPACEKRSCSRAMR
jgi:phosphoribosylformylglycinamidine synthase